MKKQDIKYGCYLQILKEELLPAFGCTEPIAIAYAAAKAREVLGCEPESAMIEASSNIIKNVKSVVVPNTGGLRGIAAAAAAGIAAGRAEKGLECICEVSPAQIGQIREFLSEKQIQVKVSDSPFIFLIQIDLQRGEEHASVRIVNYHTNIVRIEKSGAVLFEKEVAAESEDLTDRSLLNVSDILDFAETVAPEDVDETISRQIEFNSRIAAEGIRGNYGANIGKVLLSTRPNDAALRARAMAAAASDARMSGCELPVVIVSGSGNQGITASVPVIEYAKELGSSREKLIRALVLSDLVTIHQKTGIGRLSAFCGAVSAGCGSGAGIAYLYGGGYEEIAHTIVNSLAIISGMICDGAKASCAAKIATAVEAGILGYQMYCKGQQFKSGDGIITKGVEANIANVGRLAKEGMRETDREIVSIMTDC